MGYIEIDLERLETAKNEAKSYCDFHDDVQKKMLETLRNLRETWTGTDAEQFQKKVEDYFDAYSVQQRTLARAKSYAKYLNYALQEYSQAQEKSVHKAKKLIR